MTSCLGSRYLDTGERALTRQKLKGAKKFDQEEVYALFEQEPNSRFFGLPIAIEAHLYYSGLKNYDTVKYQKKVRNINERYQEKVSKAKRSRKRERLISQRDKKLNRWNRKIKEGNWRMRQGRPLAVFDSSLHLLTQKKLDQFLFNQGHLQGNTTLSFKNKGKKYVHTNYRLIKRDQYFIDSMAYSITDQTIREIIADSKQDGLKKNDIYSQKNLIDERERLFDLLTNSGYFDFSRQYIFFEVDTTSLESPAVLINTVISDPSRGENHQQYEVDSITFIGEANEATSPQEVKEYNGVTFQFGRNRYKPDLLSKRLFIERNDLYSRQNAIETQRQLTNLDAFRFVNINYDTVGGKLAASIFTSPLNKYETSNEFGFSSTQGFPGPFINVSLKNRNIFQGLELLELQGNLTLLGIGNISGEDRNYSLLQYGGVAGIVFPQFLFPLSDRLQNKVSRFNPRTSVSFSYSFEDRFNEYERQIFNASMSYKWQVRDKYNYTITPLGLGYVGSDIEPNSDFEEFLDTLRATGNGAYPASFETALITTASIDAIINTNYSNKNSDAQYLRLFAESGGNITNIVANSFPGINETQYQFVKFRIDFRQQKVLSRNAILASRIHFGLAVPYGQDPAALPYEKYFYIGGSNSIRAWPARRLGPGSFSISNTANPERVDFLLIDYTLEQGGDIILESSLELRRRLTDFLSWALFLDAGNIWQIRSSPLPPFDPTATTFDEESLEDGKLILESFLSEIAVGAGLGLRIDFGYLVFRVDGAAQVFDPGQPQGSRFVFDNINFLSAFERENSSNEIDKKFLRNKTRLNIGIGFPF